MEDYLNRLYERIRGLIVTPRSEVTAIDPNFYYNYFEFIKAYMWMLLLFPPLFTTLEWMIYSSSTFRWSEYVIKPFVMGIVLVTLPYILAQITSGIGFKFQISREPNEYAIYLVNALIPFFVFQVFKLLPFVRTKVGLAGIAYAVLIVHLIWRRVYNLSLWDELLWLLLQSFCFLLLLAVVGVFHFIYRFF